MSGVPRAVPPSWLHYVEDARDLATQRLLARGGEPTPGTSLIKRVRKGV